MARLLHKFQSRQSEQSPRPLSRTGFKSLTGQRFSVSGTKQISIVGLRESSADVVTDTGVATGNGQAGTGNVTQSGSKYAVEPVNLHGWGGRATFPSSPTPAFIVALAPRVSEYTHPWGGYSIMVLSFIGPGDLPVFTFDGANKWTITAMTKWGTRTVQRFALIPGTPTTVETDYWL